jgi:hypothetical protein
MDLILGLTTGNEGKGLAVRTLCMTAGLDVSLNSAPREEGLRSEEGLVVYSLYVLVLVSCRGESCDVNNEGGVDTSS